MGILNITPDSFSGDGLIATPSSNDSDGSGAGDTVAAAVATARRMVEEGADLLDIGGEFDASRTRPGGRRRRASPRRAGHRRCPDCSARRPDQRRHDEAAVAEAALAAGADLVNDVWGVGPSDDLPRLAGEHGVPLVVMHNRQEPVYVSLLAEIVADLQRAIDRALRLGVRWDGLIIDPGFGFGKTAEHNLELLRRLDVIGLLGRPVLLGASRQVDARQGARPASGSAGRSDPRDDGPRDRGRRGHHPSPRRPSKCPRGPHVRRSRTRDMATTRARRDATDDRPHRPRQHAVPGSPRLLRARAASRRNPSKSMSSSSWRSRPPAIDDDLGQTIDYGQVYEAVRRSSN